MGCCGDSGLNLIATLDVPVGNGILGTALDTSGLAADKSVELSGTYSGVFVVYGSHDGALWAPLMTFDSGSSSQQLRQSVPFVTKFLAVKKLARTTTTVTMSVAAKAACNCARSGSAGANQFLTLDTIPANAQVGPRPSIDLFTLVSATGLDPGAGIICGNGSFEGLIGIEGSLDGINFTPLGTDVAGQPTAGFNVAIKQRVPGTSLVVPDLSPIVIPDVVRYLRPNLRLGTVYSPVKLTVGGKQNCDCPPAAAGCSPIDLHADGTTGAFTLVGASTDALILATFPYSFACSAKANIRLDVTVDSKLVTNPILTPVFPQYGIFVVTVVPPAAQLFAVIPPDVLIVSAVPHDNNFHTFTGTHTIPNPGPGKTVIFAVAPDSTGSDVTVPEDYQYKNFIVNVTGV